MIKKGLSWLSHPLLSGSVVMVIGTNFVNILNYLYHLIMGRLLGPSFYGELAALFSLVGILGIVTLALNTVIVKYISSTSGDFERKGLVRWFTKKILIFSLALFVLVAILSPIIASFLKIDNPILVISVAVVAVFSLLMVVNKAVLQGLLRFNETVAIILAENGLKLILGVAFVYLGFSVGGAMLGLTIGAILAWLLSKSFLKGLAGSKEEINPDAKSIVGYFIPVFLQAIAVTSLYSTDLIFVKHFFDPHDAGIYAATSTLGKIIFFGASPVSLVMFPLVSARLAKGQSYRKIFVASLLTTILISTVVLLVFKLIPGIVITSLYGAAYLQAVDLLLGFGIFMVFFTLSVFLINFGLSLKKTKIVIFPLLASIAQAIGIWFYHSDLKSVILVSVTVSGLLFLCLMVYFILGKKIHK